MSDWEEIFEELKVELLNEKQENYILMRNMSTQSAMTRSRISPQIFRENFL